MSIPTCVEKKLMHVHNYGRMLECMHLCTKGCSDIKVALQCVKEHLYDTPHSKVATNKLFFCLHVN